MKNFNGYVLFGKLFRESSENVTRQKKRNVCMALMTMVQYTLMLAYKLRIERSGFDPHWWYRLVSLGNPRVLVLTLEAVAPFRHERKNVDWKVKHSVVLILHRVLSSCGIIYSFYKLAILFKC